MSAPEYNSGVTPQQALEVPTMNNVLAHAAATPPDHSTREIPLTKGKVAIVDAADYEWLNQWKWQAWKLDRNWYAMRCHKSIIMHRVILNAPPGLTVDHRDCDGLNNRRSNLRLATNAENIRNSRVHTDNSSGYKGVSWRKSNKNWTAQIHVNRRYIHLGCFVDKHMAARAYNLAAEKYFGEFARLNIIQQ